MDNETKTVTISADYFAELYDKANEPKTQMVECKGECQYVKAIAKERDELKAKIEHERDYFRRDLEATAQERDAFHRECEYLKSRKADYLEEFNSERAARNELMKELDLTRKLNAKVCTERDELKAKCEAMHSQEQEWQDLCNKYRNQVEVLNKALKDKDDICNGNCGRVNHLKKRLAAAERCIEDIEKVDDMPYVVHDIIRAWRENKEAK